MVVPRVMEKIYNTADAKAGGGLKLRTFRWATKVGFKPGEGRFALSLVGSIPTRLRQKK